MQEIELREIYTGKPSWPTQTGQVHAERENKKEKQRRRSMHRLSGWRVPVPSGSGWVELGVHGAGSSSRRRR